MSMEIQGVVEVDGCAMWQLRIFWTNGRITIWHEPLESERTTKQILEDAGRAA